MEIVEKTRGFSKEVLAEIRKVSWPTRKELQESTLLVILAVTIVMIFIGIVDRIFSALVGLVLR
jgi:preprotein translocase subunit SecE